MQKEAVGWGWGEGERGGEGGFERKRETEEVIQQFLWNYNNANFKPGQG